MVELIQTDGTAPADYMVEPLMIPDGMMECTTMLMAVEDEMMEDMEMLSLEGRVGDMKTNTVMFDPWDATVPALPVIAQRPSWPSADSDAICGGRGGQRRVSIISPSPLYPRRSGGRGGLLCRGESSAGSPALGHCDSPDLDLWRASRGLKVRGRRKDAAELKTRLADL